MKDFMQKLKDGAAPFFVDLNNKITPIHVHDMNMAVSVSSLDLFRKGISWSRNFSYKNTKNYYGLTGDRNQAYQQLVELQTQYKEYVRQMRKLFELETNDNE